MPEVRLVDHFKQFHVAVDDTVDVVHGQAGVVQGLPNRLVDHFGLVHVLPMAGMFRLPHADHRDIAILLSMNHGSPRS